MGPEDGEFAYGTLDGRVVIHQQISSLNETVESDNKVVSCIWDPLGKFICWLTLSNSLHIYNLNSKKVDNTVSLNLKIDKSELYVSKEERKMDFSADLNYLLVPSLDDKKMPFVCALKRSNNFQVEYVFAGPFSSITCVKFLPAIFENSEGIKTVFAMGDAFGQISFWEMNEKKMRESPLMLLKNEDQSMTIGNIDFEQHGNFCVASTDKKFLVVSVFDNDLTANVGQKKSVEKYLLENYGSKRPGSKEIMKTYKDLVKQKEAIHPEPEPMKIEEPKKIIQHFKNGKRVDKVLSQIQPENVMKVTELQTEFPGQQLVKAKHADTSQMEPDLKTPKLASTNTLPLPSTGDTGTGRAFMPVISKPVESSYFAVGMLMFSRHPADLLQDCCPRKCLH